MVSKMIKQKSEQRILHIKHQCQTFKQVETIMSARSSHRKRLTSRERGSEQEARELTYVVPFSFSLPNGCPASIQYYNMQHPKKLKAKIKYWIKARIVDL